jgi:hypothetical protein
MQNRQILNSYLLSYIYNTLFITELNRIDFGVITQHSFSFAMTFLEDERKKNYTHQPE